MWMISWKADVDEWEDSCGQGVGRQMWTMSGKADVVDKWEDRCGQ